MKKVSIIIPCRNEQDYIELCIKSILQQNYDLSKMEILIVDGMSTDRTKSIVKQMINSYFDKSIKLLENTKKTTPCALNLGIKNSIGEVIIILGAHSYIDENFVKNNVRNLYNKNYECSGGVIETINENFIGKAISNAMSCPFGVGNALFRYTDKECEVDTVPFAAYRRDFLDKIGYFDEQLVRNQDDELNFRVKENGGKILLSPDIKSYYYSRSSLKKLWKQYYQYGFWKVRVIQKHKKPASIRHLIPLLFVLSLILGLILSAFFEKIRFLVIIEIITYVLVDNIFSIKSGHSIKEKIILPIIFFILHFSYGLGFIMGLLNFYVINNEKIVQINSNISR